VPRVARLLALAHRFDRLLQSGTVDNGSALARLGHVSRARIAQILNLLNLSPSIQEDILFLPCTERGRDPIHLAQLLPIALTPDWKKQLRLWRRLRETTLEPAQASASRTGHGRTGSAGATTIAHVASGPEEANNGQRHGSHLETRGVT
jgi:hypothetical protein